MAQVHLDADSSTLPEVLASPPWLRRKKSRPVVIELAVEPSPLRLEWLPGEQREWADLESQLSATDKEWESEIDRAAAELDYPLIRLLSEAPEHLVRPRLPLLAQAGMTRQWDVHIPILDSGAERPAHSELPYPKLLGRYGADVLGWVAEVARRREWHDADLWQPVIGTEVTARMIALLDKNDDLAEQARTWFLRHAAAALSDLIRDAVGKGVKARREAESVLWMLDNAGRRELIRAGAATFGPAVAALIDDTLDRDPLLRLPTRVPKSPSWLTVVDLPRIRLRDSAEVVPVVAVEHLVSMLMMCAPGDDYAGVRVAAEALDPATTGDFVWALYRQWVAAKYPAKRNMWPLRALGLLGNDETAARLRTLAEGDRAVNRAVEALDMLVLMGTRNAHMHIQLALENSSWPQVRERAHGIVRDLAAGFGLSPAEFADRAVPDLGLSEHGTFIVDYGTRQFVIGLDDDLDPMVCEADGTVRESLPRPGSTDGPGAPAAYAAFASFKKALKAAIVDQSIRMETAMVQRRRWSAATQRDLYIDHPLLRQLASRLVWATFDADGTPGVVFRIDVDGTLADIDDDRIELPDDASVGIAHPLHLGDSIKTWSEVFADYGLAQPFQQLERRYFDAESPQLREGPDAFRGSAVQTGRLLALNRYGWAKGYGDNGSTTRFLRTLPGNRGQVRLYISPGIDGRDPMGIPEQTIENVVLPDDLGGPEQTWHAGLSEIEASELLRELDTLR